MVSDPNKVYWSHVEDADILEACSLCGAAVPCDRLGIHEAWHRPPSEGRDTHTIVAIPTLGESGHLDRLLVFLKGDGAVNEIIVYDNSPKQVMDGANLAAVLTVPGEIDGAVIDARGMRIYEMWNAALDAGRARLEEYRVVNVAILNDDIVIDVGTIGALARALDADPALAIVSPDADYQAAGISIENYERGDVRYVHGTYRNHGILGYCFMVRIGEATPRIDEGFEWWGGDDDLVLRIEQAGGRCGILQGLGITHYSSTTANRHPWTAEAAGRDREHFAELWGAERAW